MNTITAPGPALVGQKFEIEGMTCGHCEMAVTESIEPLDLALVASAVDEAGYRLV